MISHYEITRRLGTGSSGTVYLANDTLLQRPVVLKILRADLLTVEQIRSTVLREARLASAIEHPHVCAIYEVGESGDECYIVMQYVPGQSLDKLIAQGPVGLQRMISVGIQIADGLEAAHSRGIFHRDLKPQNVMLTDGGLVKILDFGLARRLTPEEANFDPLQSGTKDTQRVPPEILQSATVTAPGGTIRYMAPEQFVTGQSSVQSDIWALGVILYELASGRHPFAETDSEDYKVIRAIQYSEPPDLSEIVPGFPGELKSVIAHCLEKNPAGRCASAAEVREALKTVIRALEIETGLISMGAAATSSLATPEAEKRTAGLLSMLAERFRESPHSRTSPGALANSLLVLPFVDLSSTAVTGTAAPLFGYALADAIAARLARIPSLIVRPASTLMTLDVAQMDPLALGRKLFVSYVLTGNFLRSEKGFDLNWQLLDAEEQSVRSGSSISVASLDLIAVQSEIANEVFAALRGLSADEQIVAQTAPPRPAAYESAHSGPVSEHYLQGRALLSSFMVHTLSRADLERAHALFTGVTESDPEFAPAWCGLGIAELQFVRHGFGGQIHVMRARRAFDEALKLDPSSTEANLYRIHMLNSRGEKESARHGIANLLASAPNDWDVHMTAGLALRSDGLYDEAMTQFNRALQLNPANAVLIYNNRARVYHYLNLLELAGDELAKGLALDPQNPPLRTSAGYQQMRLGNLQPAIDILEDVVRDDDTQRIAVPTLAMCYVQLGERSRAAALLKDDTLAAAEADGEMAYRLATFFAVEGDSSEALHWLRRAIYLGNENYPWFQRNFAWNNLHTNADFDRILKDLNRGYRKNRKTWKRLLEDVEAGEQ
jgi:serine/threonine-protein kinase